MNDIIKSLFERKSMRAFEARSVSAEDRTLILQAALNAPSPGNQQLYSIINITEQSVKDRLADSCDHQPFIAKAPLVLIFCADMQKWYDAFIDAGCKPRKPRAGDFLLAVEDAMIAAQNAVVAAESLGIGSCYIGDILEQYEYHRELLRLPRYVVPVGMLVMGYPTQQQLDRTKPERGRLEDIVMENAYQRKDGKQLREMIQAKEAMGSYDDWMQKFCARKFNSDFSVEMSRSVEKYIDDFKE